MSDADIVKERWQALDIMKTVGLLGVFSGHLLIWWFGENLVETSRAFYNLNSSPYWLVVLCMVVVHLLLVSAGVAFYFYLRQRKPTPREIAVRMSVLVSLGILFGLNLHPPVLYWTVFLFYALSIMVIFILNRYAGEKTILFLSLLVLMLTPLLRFFVNDAYPDNYLLAVLAGNRGNVTIFYPFFPWFSLIGAGFLTGHLYSRYRSKCFSAYGLCGGAVLSLVAIPFLEKLDFSNVFGVTSQIPITYVILIFSLFVTLVSAFELILKNKTLSAYNPIVSIGRHILPVYLVVIISAVLLNDSFKKLSSEYADGDYVFWVFWSVTLLIAYLSSIILTYRAGREHRF